MTIPDVPEPKALPYPEVSFRAQRALEHLDIGDAIASGDHAAVLAAVQVELERWRDVKRGQQLAERIRVGAAVVFVDQLASRDPAYEAWIPAEETGKPLEEIKTVCISNGDIRFNVLGVIRDLDTKTDLSRMFEFTEWMLEVGIPHQTPR